MECILSRNPYSWMVMLGYTQLRRLTRMTYITYADAMGTCAYWVKVSSGVTCLGSVHLWIPGKHLVPNRVYIQHLHHTKRLYTPLTTHSLTYSVRMRRVLYRFPTGISSDWCNYTPVTYPAAALSVYHYKTSSRVGWYSYPHTTQKDCAPPYNMIYNVLYVTYWMLIIVTTQSVTYDHTCFPDYYQKTSVLVGWFGSSTTHEKDYTSPNSTACNNLYISSRNIYNKIGLLRDQMLPLVEWLLSLGPQILAAYVAENNKHHENYDRH